MNYRNGSDRAGLAGTDPATPAAAPDTPVEYPQNGSLVSVRCGPSGMSIRASGLRYNRTSLHVRRSAGSIVELRRPSEMADCAAVGLACAQAATGEPYFIVEYGELPLSCKFCEWHFLHDTSGSRLTHSDPPVLFDTDSPHPAGQYVANNREFSALAKKLRIDVRAAEIVFAECRRDPDDTEFCTVECSHGQRSRVDG